MNTPLTFVFVAQSAGAAVLLTVGPFILARVLMAIVDGPLRDLTASLDRRAARVREVSGPQQADDERDPQVLSFAAYPGGAGSACAAATGVRPAGERVLVVGSPSLAAVSAVVQCKLRDDSDDRTRSLL